MLTNQSTECACRSADAALMCEQTACCGQNCWWFFCQAPCLPKQPLSACLQDVCHQDYCKEIRASILYVILSVQSNLPWLDLRCHVSSAGKQVQQHKGMLRPPWLRVVQLIILWGVFLALQLLKSRQYRCQPMYFILFTVQALVALLSGAFFTLQVRVLAALDFDLQQSATFQS